MLKQAVLIAIFGFLVTGARADTFDVTQITVSFEQFSNFPFPSAGVSMSGPKASLSYGGVAIYAMRVNYLNSLSNQGRVSILKACRSILMVPGLVNSAD
jgi:hypothetical protein